MALLFAQCAHCGQPVEDRLALMAARHFPWDCPLCGKENAPLLQGIQHQDTVTPEDEEEITTDSHGLTGEGTVLFMSDDGSGPGPGR